MFRICEVRDNLRLDVHLLKSLFQGSIAARQCSDREIVHTLLTRIRSATLGHSTGRILTQSF